MGKALTYKLTYILLQDSFSCKLHYSFSYWVPDKEADSVPQIRQSCILDLFWIYRLSMKPVSCPPNLPLCSINHISKLSAGQLPNQLCHSLDYCASLLLIIEHFHFLSIILEFYYPIATVIQFIKSISYC